MHDDLRAGRFAEALTAARVVVVVVRDDDVLDLRDAEVAQELCALVEGFIVAESRIDQRSFAAVADQPDVRWVRLGEPREVDVEAGDVRGDLDRHGRSVSLSVGQSVSWSVGQYASAEADCRTQSNGKWRRASGRGDLRVGGAGLRRTLRD